MKEKDMLSTPLLEDMGTNLPRKKDTMKPLLKTLALILALVSVAFFFTPLNVFNCISYF
jgi:hypothetical protein